VKIGGYFRGVKCIFPYYYLGNLVCYYGSYKRCYYLTGYALLIITGLSLLLSNSMFFLDEL
jgi:hypothetical protein